MTAYGWEHDPKRLVFQYARYKFVAKMLAGKADVLEVGCADGQGARIVRQHVGALSGIDIDAQSIAEANRLQSKRWPCTFYQHDIMQYVPKPGFDAVYSLDLFEHIPPEQENLFLSRLQACAPVVIIGTPSLESQSYASEISKAGHVNCKSGEALRADMLRYWSHVFLFSMNDEVVHTGYLPMAHYLMAIGVR